MWFHKKFTNGLNAVRGGPITNVCVDKLVKTLSIYDVRFLVHSGLCRRCLEE